MFNLASLLSRFHKEDALEKFHYVLIVVAVLIFGVTAYNSQGYHHPDEHYQIIEFAKYALGSNTEENLPWEFGEKIRSSLQPLIYAGFIKAAEAVNITSPYTQIQIMRAITGLFAIFCIGNFIKSSIKTVPKSWKVVYMILSYFLWFIPFISVRYSSETWSGLFFLLALSIVIRQVFTKKTCYLIGLFLGISFLFRYQTAVMSAGLFTWLIVIQKTNWKYAFKIILSGIIVITCGLLLDSYFYRDFTLTFWNYFNVNLIEGVASQFGRSPWFTIFKYLFIDTIWPIGFILFICFVSLICYQPRNIVLWCILPFLFIHGIIAHKELRFLFPAAYLAPIILVQGAHLFYVKILQTSTSKTTIDFILALCLAFVTLINSIAVIINASEAAGDRGKEITRYIFIHYHAKPAKLIYFRGANPFKPYSDLMENYYAIPSLKFVELHDGFELQKNILEENTTQLLVVKRQYADSPGFKQKIQKLGFKLKVSAQPKWIEYCKSWYGNNNPNQQLILYSIETAK